MCISAVDVKIFCCYIVLWDYFIAVNIHNSEKYPKSKFTSFNFRRFGLTVATSIYISNCVKDMNILTLSKKIFRYSNHFIFLVCDCHTYSNQNWLILAYRKFASLQVGV